MNGQCLFTKQTKQGVVIVLLNVDDVLIIGPSQKSVDVVKQCISKEFKMTDTGEVDCFIYLFVSSSALTALHLTIYILSYF